MRKNTGVRWIGVTLVTCLIASPTDQLASAAAPKDSLKLQLEQKIAPGTTYKEYSEAFDDGNVKFHEVEVDLKDPNVKVAPIYGNGGQIGSKAKVSAMANQAGAIAAINSSFFRTDNEGGTLGMLVKDGKFLSSSAKVPGWNTFAIVSDGHALISQFGFTGRVIAPNGKSFPLEGMNKTEYFAPGSVASNYSGTIHLFTKEWGPNSRGIIDGYNDILEMEVKDNTVTELRVNSAPKPIPTGGYVLFANGEGAQFLRDNFHVGDNVDVNYRYTPNDLVLNQAIGANYLLVDGGAPVTQFPTDPDLIGKHSRSAVGVDQTGTKLFLVAVDKSDQNPGATLPELADILISLGASKGVNLDGGSSTSLAVEKPGDFQATRVDDSSSETPVADSLGIFNMAPQGLPDHLEISGPKQAVVGQASTFTFKGWDTNYHPIDPNTVSWSVTDSMGKMTGNQVLWTQAGSAKVTVKVGEKTAEYPVVISTVSANQSFNDIADHWARKNIELMAQKGYAKGTGGGAFSPDRSLTRADFIVFLSRMLDWKVTDEDRKITFKEDVPAYAADSLKYAKRTGIIVGDLKGRINPSKPITRMEAAAILARVLPQQATSNGGSLKEAYDDWAQIPSWARSSVQTLTDQQIFGGMNHNFYPQKDITRAEMVTVLLRAFVK
jgi:exopolysaccharide biosynthesis protein